jgi:hypothetical protein
MPQLASLGAGALLSVSVLGRLRSAVFPRGVLTRAPALRLRTMPAHGRERALRAPGEDDVSPSKIDTVWPTAAHCGRGCRDPHWVALSPLRTHARRRAADARRDRALARFGYRVLRLEAPRVLTRPLRALAQVREALDRH